MSLDGRLQDFDILFVLRSMIEQSRPSQLLLATDDGEGEITVGNGRIMDARVGEITGLDALFDLLSWQEGTFHLTQGAETSPTTIDLGWSQLLREAFRRAKLASETPPPGDSTTDAEATREAGKAAPGTDASTRPDDTNEIEAPDTRKPPATPDSTANHDETPAQETPASLTLERGPEAIDSPITEPVPIAPVPPAATPGPQESPPASPSDPGADPEADPDIGPEGDPRPEAEDFEDSATESFAIDASVKAENRLLDLLPRLEHEAVRLSNAPPSEGPHAALRTLARLIRFVRTNPNQPDSESDLAGPIDQLLAALNLDNSDPPSGDMLIAAYHAAESLGAERRRALLAASSASLEITALHFQALTSTFESADEKLRFREAYQTVISDLEHRLHQAPF